MNDKTQNGSLDSKDSKDQVSQPTERSMLDSGSVNATDDKTEHVEIYFLDQDDKVIGSPHQDDELPEPPTKKTSKISQSVATIIAYWVIALLCLLIAIGTVIVFALTKGDSPSATGTPDLTQTLNVVILSAIPQTPRVVQAIFSKLFIFSNLQKLTII